MKKDTILIALLIGVAVFLMRWIRAFTFIGDYEVHFLPLFAIFWGIKLYFRKLRTFEPGNLITFGRALWLGMRMSLIASFCTGVLCMSFIDYPADVQRMFPALYLHAIPFISTMAYGVLVSILCSAFYVYFKPIKINHLPNFGLHTGHHSLY